MYVPNLKRLRQQAVLSQEELAAQSGLGRDTISKLENGQRRAHRKTIRKLAAGLNVEPEELIAINSSQVSSRSAALNEGSCDRRQNDLGF